MELFTSLFVILRTLVVLSNGEAFMSPFFMYCNNELSLDDDSDVESEIALTLSIEGDPEFYKPGNVYKMTIASNQDFDGFQINAVFAMTPSMAAGDAMTSIPFYGGGPYLQLPATGSEQSTGQRLMCSRRVHAHFGYQPQHELQFLWMAPPEGTGCISFKGTATRNQQILFNSVTILYICEEGSKIDLSALHEEGMILRDDFDSSKEFDTEIWRSHLGLEISAKCGLLLHGMTAVACQKSGSRELISVPLNLTTASVIQFAVASGRCKSSPAGTQLTLSFGTNDCTNWTQISSVIVPVQKQAAIHVIHLPLKARSADICIKWEELLGSNSSQYDGCWALDNIVIVNMASPPTSFEDGFDPINPGNWLFFPGAQVQHQCLSEQKAMVFEEGMEDQIKSATTRGIDLEAGLSTEDNLIGENFEVKDHLEGWLVDGGGVSTECSEKDNNYHLVFADKSQTRRLCTPYMDLSLAGNIRFWFMFGDDSCSKGILTTSKVYVYVEDKEGHSSSLYTLSPQSHQVAREISLSLTDTSQMTDARVCWTQKTHRGSDWDVWAVDDVYILTAMPKKLEYFVQFDLTLSCGKPSDNISVVLEYSTDHGKRWEPLYEKCTNLRCFIALATTTAYFHGDQYNGWHRVTLPMPHAAMTKYTRFRWSQLSGFNSSWALDNVYIGNCTNGCNNHGRCTKQGCLCDTGFHGPTCEIPDILPPTFLIEDLSSKTSDSFVTVHGLLALGYTCGIVATGKALVFNGDGARYLETIDLNTTDTMYLQYSIRMGSDSAVGPCPSPDQPDEVLLLHSTCDGGITWNLLQKLMADDYTQPMMLSVPLPPAVQGGMCRFVWWQPLHSGHGRDMWAIDDISITSTMYNTIDIKFDPEEDDQHALEIHLGEINPYCGLQQVLSFTNPYQEGEFRILMTRSMRIGPSYILQFDLVMGCDYLFVPDIDNALYLEYSTNHGMTWSLVHNGCWPPRMCREYHAASIYHSSEFQKWRRVTVILPPHTWSSTTRLRLRQPYWSYSDSWAVDNLYIGLQCPQMCHGHGYCRQARCRCDDGFGGTTCKPETKLPSTLKSDFSLISQLHNDWLYVVGGELAGANQGCGTMLSGESLYFYQSGPRKLVSRSLNTTKAQFLEFFIQLGGENDLQCFGIETREENILVQYSTNGGITWHLLKELQGPDYLKPSIIHIDLPKDASAECVQFRWWQPKHSGSNADQWAIDQIQLSGYKDLTMLQDDFELHDDPRAAFEDLWQLLTEPMYAPYCGSTDDTLMFANQPNDKIAMTKDLRLSVGDMIQFAINVGCSKTFSPANPVLLEYSHDSGLNWKLVEEPCYMSNVCHNKFRQGSIYYTGPYGEWKEVTLTITEAVANRRVNLRWFQPGGIMSNFALNDVYIGPPCPSMCNGHGTCSQGQCHCHQGFGGKECLPLLDQPYGMVDTFEGSNLPSELWDGIMGAYLGLGCGVIGSGNSLYFHGDGPREAKTVPINMTSIRLVQFTIRIGNKDNKIGCSRPHDRMEGVIVDYTLDNGISWNVLEHLDPELFMDQPRVVQLELPSESKSDNSVIRWWQPLLLDHPRAEWALDDVIIAINDTSRKGFQENFNPMKPDIWYRAVNAIPKITCQSPDDALEFSKNGEMRYAETWDYEVTPSTFLQFDIAMGCSGTYSTLYNVMLEYSVDMGRTWHPIVEECLPPKLDCTGYHLSSNLNSEAYANWTRVTLYLPPGAVSSATRFRWLQQTVTLRGNVWALDNIYLGEGCPWMCSGHGYCDQGTCRCDPGYFGVFCVPSVNLPVTLRDDFDFGLRHDLWPEVYGGEVSNICGLLVSGNMLTFYKDNLRMAVTRELDVSMAKFIQFHFRYGCEPVVVNWPRHHTVLLQYSTNGGIVWHLLEDLHEIPSTGNRYINILLPASAQTNATKFRFWQPQHDGHMKSVWSLDNVFIGGSVISADSLVAILDSEPNILDWLFWPGGVISRYCGFNIRKDTLLTSPQAMVFSKNPGVHAITTKDLNVNDITVIQFEINVGCTDYVSKDYPVRLEYSVDFGKTWQLVIDPCYKNAGECIQQPRPDATVYYAGVTKYWQRIIVTLKDLKICGRARFRWYQGFFKNVERALEVPTWAIKNVYIGMQCQHNCMGHGTCMYGVLCQCDENYSGDFCQTPQHNPTFIKEDFNGTGIILSPSKWHTVSGAERTTKCGILADGSSLHFISHGARILTTVDLDLTTAVVIQFYIKLGCSRNTPDLKAEPVQLQFSKDGGITWETLQRFYFGPNTNKVKYIALEVPHKMKTAATMVRWKQLPGTDGTFLEEWAIDEIYIGGSSIGRIILQDDMSRPNITISDNWLQTTGAIIQPKCGLSTNVLYFNGDGEFRYAITNDVTVTEATYMQFYLSMGCTSQTQCFGIQLEYSVDYGKTWQLLETECMPFDVECTTYNGRSVFMSDVYADWTRITVLLPYYTRTRATRFRFIQQTPLDPSHTWAIANIYIGDECKCSCSGHGQCVGGKCRCDKGWSGDSCTEAVSPLPNLLMDSFTEGASDKYWIMVNGAVPTTECGVLSSGTSLHFKGNCTRQLISTDLDLRQAIYIQFNFRFGCLSPPTNRNQSVLLDYSRDACKTWNKIIELYYDQYKNGSYVMIDIPEDAKHNGIRIRLWQPHHGGRSKSDWAIDNIIIGGKQSNFVHLQDTFSDAPSDIWLQRDNMKYSPYCGSKDSVMGSPRSKESVILMTADLMIQKDYIIQFSISIGCNASWDALISPVHLEYSTNYGMSWHHLQEECLPFLPHCHGAATTSSVYFASPGWRRVTILLNGPIISKQTRFRWRQDLMLEPTEPYRQHWALDDVYIGQACPRLCSGHGLCQYPRCHCDPGYGGSYCEESKPVMTYIKETFDLPEVNRSRWLQVQGGHITDGCVQLVEGTALHFSSPGRREVVTVDLDLRNARFVQYHVMIGGSQSGRKECGTPTFRNESILLQYSADSGTTWHLLHLLDYNDYWIVPRRDYVMLPREARTINTRIRWWQPLADGDGDRRHFPAGWTLDDVFIGGREINPSDMYQAFQSNGPLESVEFHPGGVLDSGICGKRDAFMIWKDDARPRSFTTEQLIIQDNYMLQFKIMIGCGDAKVDKCDKRHPVLLQYNRDPSTDAWDLVYPKCVLNSHETNMDCIPYRFDIGSIYSVDSYQEWSRVTLRLPLKVFSSQTRLRWIQETGDSPAPRWALDEIYIGEQCPEMCHGRGDCVRGECHCDPGYDGPTCQVGRLPLRLSDGFEGGISSGVWVKVEGGGLGMGCGALSPLAHGKNLYFNGCGIRQAITREIDTSRAMKIMFVLQIGSNLQTASCNIDLSLGPGNGMVILQFSINKGIDWHLIATHAASEFMVPKKVGYNIPHEAMRRGTQFRWWQPEHQGAGRDQWAIDDIDIITTRQDQMRAFDSKIRFKTGWPKTVHF